MQKLFLKILVSFGALFLMQACQSAPEGTAATVQNTPPATTDTTADLLSEENYLAMSQYYYAKSARNATVQSDPSTGLPANSKPRSYPGTPLEASQDALKVQVTSASETLQTLTLEQKGTTVVVTINHETNSVAIEYKSAAKTFQTQLSLETFTNPSGGF